MQLRNSHENTLKMLVEAQLETNRMILSSTQESKNSNQEFKSRFMQMMEEMNNMKSQMIKQLTL